MWMLLLVAVVLVLCVRYPWAWRLTWVAVCATCGAFMWTVGVLVLAIPAIVSAVIVVLVLFGRHRPRSTAVAMMTLDRDR